MRGPSVIALVVLSAIVAAPSHAQTSNILGDNYSIMVPEKGSKPARPEPWLAPKYKSPRGKYVTIPKSTIVPIPNVAVPPPIIVPQTGRVLPNLPTASGSGRGGAETYQDRAARCAHQAGVYGQAGRPQHLYRHLYQQ
jgi:hypothetical protein